MDVRAKLQQWNYLIVTASNEAQARAYESQLKVRKDLGFLSSIHNLMVVPDPGGKRIGSGGSTLYCLIEVLNQQLGQNPQAGHPVEWEKILRNMRILILHAGGDSRRLPTAHVKKYLSRSHPRVTPPYR